MAHSPDNREQSLDGAWSLSYAHTRPAGPLQRGSDIAAAGLPLLHAQVPGNVELDLADQGLLPADLYRGMNIAEVRRFEDAHLWYWRPFRCETPPAGEAELVFEGLDCLADVYLNGELIGRGDNMLVPQVFTVTGRLRMENELFVHLRPVRDEAQRHDYPAALFASPCCTESLYVRKAPHMWGWDIMPRVLSGGIWRPVWLRTLPANRIVNLYLQTDRLADDRSEAALSLSYQTHLTGVPDGSLTLAMEGRCGDSVFEVRVPLVGAMGLTRLNVPHPRLWWPRGRGPADLYDVTVRLLHGDVVLDTRTFRHGIRTVALARTSVTDAAGHGAFCFSINGERQFVLGTNWVPMDAFHSRDRARIPTALALAEEVGCNVFRCWGGNVYEDDLFFDLCDEKGFLVWQDFAMACGIYPQDDAFASRLGHEARAVVRRLRQHPCLILWAGDNECDSAPTWIGRNSDPNQNRLTRQVLPEVLRAEDPSRPYLPSSPYIDEAAFAAGGTALPEDHLWGPRGYYKAPFYRESICHFASEIGYHGCPEPASVRAFITPERLWPYQNNPEWLLHATSPIPGFNLCDYRVELMASQVRALFGTVPDSLGGFALASQIVQAEAMKFFVEMFRMAKWRRTGIIWWNLIDGWPQFSDAVVDYYGRRKLAFGAIQRAQQPICLMLGEPLDGRLLLVGVNDTRESQTIRYRVTLAGTARPVVEGEATLPGDAATRLITIACPVGGRGCFHLSWEGPGVSGRNHYLAGEPTFSLANYRTWLEPLLHDDPTWRELVNEARE